MDHLSPLKAARQEKLLDAALHLFVTRGYRGTSMEAIAEAAGLSKVTLYSYFRDKDAAFEGVALRLADRLHGAVAAALLGDGPAFERVTAALQAKHAMVHDIVRVSAFAPEIMAQKLAVARIFADLDRQIIAEIAEALNDPGLARLLFHAATGIAENAGSRDEMLGDIERLVRGMVPPQP